ncbi:apolipoprotein L1 [Eucyclogobius newberryi]|uniref:apolipoprotein L1 n=1 Tax=Eucyclogobius newberryi TaxID=166745 RepID=UPI003B59E09A
MFRKSPKIFTRTQSQDDLSDPIESTEENHSENTKEKGGLFSGVFKKPKGAKSHSEEDLTSELSGSKEELSDNNNTKEKGGLLSGVFKKPKLGARSQSKDDLSADDELSNSKENLTENNTKEKSGILSGVFKKPKLGARSQSKDHLSADGELSNSQENLTENGAKDKAGLFGGMFKKQKGLGAKSQSQDDLSENCEKSGSSDNLTEKASKGGVSNFLKNPFGSSAQKEEKVEKSDKNEPKDGVSSSEKPKAKQNGFSAMMKNTFYSDKQEKLSDSEASVESGEQEQQQQSVKPGKFADAMTKLNPFRAGHKTDKSVDLSDDEQKEEDDKPKEHKQKEKETEDQETTPKDEKREEEKHKTVKSKVSQFEQRDRSETILVPTRTPRVKDEVNKEMVSKEKRPTQAEMDSAKKTGENPEETSGKHGRLYPSLLAAVETGEEAKEADDDDETSTREENKDEEGKDKAEEKAKKPKRRNPFMPQVKKVGKKKEQEEAESDRTLFDQLEDFRVEPSAEEGQDVDHLMEWWDTVENWEDTPQSEDMTPKEEAKAFAVTADKIQKGIRVFNKLFSERAESLWQHVIDLNGIADALDKFNKKTKIAQITGGSTSATGGVLTITGLALAPITMGTSLIVTAVGLGIATAGGLTSAGAGISNQVNNSMDRKKVEKIVEDYQEKMQDLNKALKFIKQGIEQLRQFDLIKIKKNMYNRDFPVLNSRFYEDGAMAGKAILINANEIMRVVQIANVAGSTAARAVQIASMATGVLTGLFVGMDIYFVAKDSKELRKGAKSEFAAKIREVAQQLHDGLVEMNTIREELQATTAPDSNYQECEGGEQTGEKKKDQYDDDEEEDEIDRIKKQMKKDYENREWV